MGINEISDLLIQHGWVRVNEHYWKEDAMREFNKGIYDILLDIIKSELHLMQGSIPLKVHKFTSESSIKATILRYSK